MEEKTKKKRVTAQKRAARKTPEVAKTVPAEPAAPVTVEPKKVEAKKVKRSTKGISKSVSKKSASVNATRVKPTFEQIQVRAYFISERRRKLGIPGDQHHDWMAAEQELRTELVVG
jgi:outer membrane biosynthesis protein TonB